MSQLLSVALALHILSLGQSSSESWPTSASQTGCKGRHPNGTGHGEGLWKGPYRRSARTGAAASALVCHSTTSSCSVPPAWGYLSTPLRYLLSLLSCIDDVRRNWWFKQWIKQYSVPKTKRNTSPSRPKHFGIVLNNKFNCKTNWYQNQMQCGGTGR